MDDLFDLLHRFKSAFEKEPKKESANNASPPGTEGAFFRLWSWLLPLLLGLTAGWFAMVCLEIWLEGHNMRSRPAVTAYDFTAYVLDDGTDNFAVFLRTNPFGVTAMPTPDLMPRYTPQPQIVSSLASAILTGTSPGHMAWMRYQERLRLILVGSQFYSYTLLEVTALDATFINGEYVIKHLIFGSTPLVYQVPQPARHVAPPAPSIGAAGQISRDLVNQLLENPFDELREIRIRPADGDQGLQIEWITGDSIFAQLGVQYGDVIRSVNGIAFRNVMDVTNSLNSLMESDQFVVEVMRGGVPVLLQYVVR